jgi:hypothetical protein
MASPAAFSVAVALFTATGLWLDRSVGLNGQLALGLAAWLFLYLACRYVTPEQRTLTLIVIVVATVGEILASLVWGIYTYRLDNLPTFIPPGHGLIYLASARVAQTTLVRAHSRAFVGCVLAGALVWTSIGLLHPSRPDVLGALAMVALGYFLLAGKRSMLYASAFVAAGLLELYGTAIGTWEWAGTVPTLGITAGNPPSGIAAGYCLFDAIAFSVAARLPDAIAVRARRLGLAPSPA